MHASDLVRNLVLSPWMACSLDEQERLYELEWLAKIELPCNAKPAVIDKILTVCNIV